MTSHTFYKKDLDADHRFTQTCFLPAHLFKNSYVKFGDFISVNCDQVEYICRVFLSSHVDRHILFDDTVSYFKNFKISNCKVNKQVFHLPEDITVIKISKCKKVQIKIEYQENNNYNMSLIQLAQVSLELLESYVVRKNSIVNFDKHEFANLLKISKIHIINTFFETSEEKFENIFGRISRATSVEVIGLISFDQSKLLKEYVDIEIGGFDDAFEQLNLSIKVCKKVLVVGPPGCGKSTLIKKFCCKLNSFVLMLDSFSDINLEKCQSCCAQLINVSKLFTNCHCILFLDNIHLFEQSTSQQKSFHLNSSVLLYLLQSLEEHNVIIIATALHKGLLSSFISQTFDTEVSLGILSLQQRKHLIKTLVNNINCPIDCDYLANKTAGFVAGDLVLFFDTLLHLLKSYESKGDTQSVSKADIDEILSKTTPSLLKTSEWSLKVKPIYWQDIGGMQDIKERLQLCIEKPLLHPEIFKKVDLPSPRGVLLFGPPGCCKTTIARGLATECKANFFAASPSQIYSPFVGESEKNISQLFYEAKICMPSIIFLDELDCLVGRREIDSKMIGVAEKVLSTLLTEMDGFGVSAAYGGGENPQKYLSYCGDDKTDTNERITDQVVIIAATNRPDLIDDALLRPGRFDMILYIPPPNLEEREKILETYTSGLPLLNVNLRMIAEKAENFSGADLKHLQTMAGLNALRNNENAEYISEHDFLEALKTVKPSISYQQIQMYEQMASKYGTFISK